MSTVNHNHRNSKKVRRLCYIIKSRKPVETVRVFANGINISENAVPYCSVQADLDNDEEYLLKPLRNFELRELGSNSDFLSPSQDPYTYYYLISDAVRKTPLYAYNFIKVVHISENQNTLGRDAFVSECSVDDVPRIVWRQVNSDIFYSLIFSILIILAFSLLAILIQFNLQHVHIFSNSNRLLILYLLFLLSTGFHFKARIVHSDVFILGLLISTWRRFF